VALCNAIGTTGHFAHWELSSMLPATREGSNRALQRKRKAKDRENHVRFDGIANAPVAIEYQTLEGKV